MIPLSAPDITEAERKAVQEVLATATLSLGPKQKEFEEKVAQYVGRKYAIAVNSGTAALHLIVRALGIGEGDEVITTPFSFISSSNCILFENATPVFCDIDEQTLQIDPAKIEAAITQKTKAILAVDVFGHSADWDAILQIAEKHKLFVIEDSAEAIGGLYKGRKCGSFGNAAIFSFYPNKQITTGEGGMILVDDNITAELCQSMANQGRKVKGGEWLEHVRLGYNYRLGEIPCALGVAQLGRLQEILQKRDRVANQYTEKLQELSGVQVPWVSPDVMMSWFVYVIRLEKSYTKEQRDAVLAYLENKGVQCRPYFVPIHLQPFYRQKGYTEGDFPVTESVGNRTIALPFFNNLSEQDIDTVVTTLQHALHDVS